MAAGLANISIWGARQISKKAFVRFCVGFLGHTLLEHLYARYGDAVHLFSTSRTQRYPSEHWTWLKCDLTSVDSLRHVLEKTRAQTVFMPAASHYESSKEEARAVNVEGAKALIKACQDAGVKRFIYTSSTAVYFDGSDLIYVKESDPLPKQEDLISAYGASKAEGERIVLEANGKQGLYTCALRLSGSIGEGDTTVLPQGMGALHAGQGFFQLGDNKNKQDFDHIENATYGHCLACEKLLDTADPSMPGPAAGEAFNITCGEPLEFFTFWRKVYHEYNGYQPYFTVAIPVWIAYIIAFINEMFMWLFNIKPRGLTRYNLVWATAWRAHSIEKAQNLLGYEPVVSLDEGIRRAVKAYKEDEAKQRLAKAERKRR